MFDWVLKKLLPIRTLASTSIIAINITLDKQHISEIEELKFRKLP